VVPAAWNAAEAGASRRIRPRGRSLRRAGALAGRERTRGARGARCRMSGRKALERRETWTGPEPGISPTARGHPWYQRKMSPTLVRRGRVAPAGTLAVALLMTSTALAQQAPATAAQTPVPSPYAAPPSVAGWRMEFKANDPRARLEIRDLPGLSGDDDDEGRLVLHWRMLCGPSCETVVDPRATLRVGGPGLVPSEPFTLETPVRVARVWATATNASRSRRSISFMIQGFALFDILNKL